MSPWSQRRSWKSWNGVLWVPLCMPGSAALKALLGKLLLNRNKNSHWSVLLLERKNSIYWIMIGWWLWSWRQFYITELLTLLILSVPVPPHPLFFFLFSCFLFLGWHFRVSALLPDQQFQKKEERWEVELMSTVSNLLFEFVFKVYMFPICLTVNEMCLKPLIMHIWQSLQ